MDDIHEFHEGGTSFMRGCIVGLMFSVPAWALIILAIVKLFR